MTDNRAFVRALIEQVRLGRWTPEQVVGALESLGLNADMDVLCEAVRLAQRLEPPYGAFSLETLDQRRGVRADRNALIDTLAQPRVPVGGDCE